MAQKKANVSVIVPVYCVEQYLDAALESLAAQSLRELEIILVDDGSPDGSSRALDAFAQEHANCVVYHKRNGGLSDARNKGMAIAAAEYLAFMDPDDVLLPHAYERLRESATTYRSDIVFCGYEEVYSESLAERRDVPLYEHSDNVVEAIQTFIEGGYGAYAWNKLFRRRLIEQFGLLFPEGVHLVEDSVFFCAYMEHARSYSVVHECLYRYIRRDNSLCATYHREQFEFYRKGNDAKRQLIEACVGEDERLLRVNDEAYLRTCLNVLDQMNGRGNKTSLKQRYTQMLVVAQDDQLRSLLDEHGEALHDKENATKARLIRRRRYKRLFLHELWRMRVVARVRYYIG